jgi:long-chain acyl-CoA synthetase
MTITSLTKAQHADRGHADYLRRLASVGVAQTGVDVRVVDAEGKTLSTDEAGEIIVKGPTVMAGYWNLPTATQSALQNGWLYTGDVGSFDSDGFLTLKARSKEVIISGGTNIYPREIEEVLLRHQLVREVAVVGKPHPEWGEIVVAFVVADANNPGLAQELDQLCLQHIARFKRPKDYVFLSALPKNATGKVLKAELRTL